MRSPLRKLVVVCLLLLTVAQPPTPRQAPPVQFPAMVIGREFTAREIALRHDRELVAFFASVAKPPVPPPPRRLASPASYADGSIEALICSVFGPACAKAIAIARCESGLNPNAYNKSGASGLFQLLGHGAMFEAHGWSAGDWPDPYKNSVVAFDLYSASGWSPWVCKP